MRQSLLVYIILYMKITISIIDYNLVTTLYYMHNLYNAHPSKTHLKFIFFILNCTIYNFNWLDHILVKLEEVYSEKREG